MLCFYPLLEARPDPTPGTLLEIGFLGTVLQVEIPHSGDDAQQIRATISKKNDFDPKLHVSLCHLQAVSND